MMENAHPTTPFLVLTVAFPGFGASRSQIAKYTGSDGVVVLRGRQDSIGHRAPADVVSGMPEQTRWLLELLSRLETVDIDRCRRSPSDVDDDHLTTAPNGVQDSVLYHAVCAVATHKLLFHVMPSPEVVELTTSSWSWNPLHWATMAKSRGAAWYFSIRGVPTSFMRLDRVNLAGFDDQAACAAEIAKGASVVEAEGKGRKLVLFGCSRGASTTCFASLKLPPEVARHVGLVILEAPFDSLESVVHASSWTPRLVMRLIKCLGQYDGDAGAYKLPEKTNLRCPVAFVTSAADTRVPEACTLRLMHAMEAAYPHLTFYHLRLRHSSHAMMPIGNAEDKTAYAEFVHELYRKHCVPES